MTLGFPGFVLFLARRSTGLGGDAALSTAVKSIGFPFGILGGIAVLVTIGFVVNVLSKVVIDSLVVRFYQKRSQLEASEKLLSEIDRLPLSGDLKIKLKWVAMQNPLPARSPIKVLIWRTLISLTLIVTLASLAGYLGRFHQLLELTAHFKLQYLCLSCLTFVYFRAVHRKKVWWIVSLFCILINLIEIAPWYIPQGIAAQSSEQPFRVLLSNVYYPSKDYTKVISLVREEKPDVAIFIEVSKIWSKELETLQDILPYSLDTNQFGVTGGVAMYSKLPLENPSVRFFAKKRGSLSADVTLQGRTLSLIATHPSIPTQRSSFVARNKQLSNLTHYVAQIENPVVVIGDLNITMWSPFYKSMVTEAELRNARSGFGVLPTWPTFFPPLSIPLDHCLVSPDIQVLEMRTGRDVGSDHLPIIVDLLIPKN